MFLIYGPSHVAHIASFVYDKEVNILPFLGFLTVVTAPVFF